MDFTNFTNLKIGNKNGVKCSSNQSRTIFNLSQIKNSNIKAQGAKAKQKREILRKRTKTLFKKADELRSIAGAKVYCVLNVQNKWYFYTSIEQPSWPPTMEQLVC